ncbi:RHS repeat-associated core domain-containing protein [Flectobacillus major]|uniref:RHS repeat-associated core domain-containing protein n=1 Tax=Flectobacillus major TaxID=103 RepID=UPI0003F74006|nr:RHS repeat-associated core domain-containing protein [Flectobacillus major]
MGIAKITQANAYGVWGEDLPTLKYLNTPKINNFGYLNREFQSETGYTDLVNRQFDNIIGRFTSQDPVIEGQEHLSLYQYSWNNPILRSDPDGKEPCCGGASPSSILWSSAGYTHNPNEAESKQLATTLLKDVGKGLATAALILMPVEELAVEGLALIGLKVESTILKDAAASLLKSESTIVKESVTTEKITKAYERPNSATTKSDGYAPKEALPRNTDGTPKADPEALGRPHTQLGTKGGSKGDYRQAREFDGNGKPIRDIDFTDHGRPQQGHTNPHQHRYIQNETGGTAKRGKAESL